MKTKYFEEIAISRTTNDVHFNLNQQIVNCLEEDNFVIEKYPVPSQAYLSAFEKEDELMNLTRKSLLTADVKAEDEKRVFEYRNIRDGVKFKLSSLNGEAACGSQLHRESSRQRTRPTARWCMWMTGSDQRRLRTKNRMKT